MSTNVYVTGSSGVKGNRVVRGLAAAMPAWSVIPVTVDLRDLAQVTAFCEDFPTPDLLVHLAARVPTVSVREDPVGAYSVNALGTGHIIQATVRSNPNLWTLYASTSHVYQSSRSPIRETAPLEPVTIYGRTKLAGEMVAADTVAIAGMSGLCIARIFSVYSSDQPSSFLYPTMLSRKSSWDGKRPLVVEGWNNVRDFLSAEEVASRLLQLILGRAEGVFKIGSGIGLTVREFAHEALNLNIEPSPSSAANPATYLVADTSRYERFVNAATARG